MVQERKIALLVDAENVSHHRIGQVMTAVKNNLGGLVTVKRIYAIGPSPISPHGRLIFGSMPSFPFSSTPLPLARTLRIFPW